MYCFNFFRNQLWQHLISYNRFRNMNMCYRLGRSFAGGQYPITCHELSLLSGVGIFTNMPLVLNWKLHLRCLTRLWACLKGSWFLFKSYPPYAHTPSDFSGGHFSISDFISCSTGFWTGLRVITILVLLWWFFEHNF